MFLLYSYLIAFLSLVNFFLVIGSDVGSKKLFFPTKSEQFSTDSDYRLIRIRDSFETIEGQAKEKYLDALVAEIDNKRVKADELSIQAYQEYLLSKPYGNLIKKQGSIPQALWNLLCNYPLNSEIINLLQNILESISVSSINSCDFAQLQSLINAYGSSSLDVQNSQDFKKLQEVLEAKERLFALESVENSKIREQEVVLSNRMFAKFRHKEWIITNYYPKDFFEKLLNVKHDRISKESLYSLVMSADFYNWLVVNLSVTHDNTMLIDQRIKDRVSIIARKLDNNSLCTKLAFKIKQKDSSCSMLPIRTTVKFVCFTSDELTDLNLAGVDRSFIDQNMMSKIIVLTGHTDTGDVIELINFPKENKLFSRMEIIDRTNVVPVISTQEPTTARALANFGSGSGSFASKKKHGLNDDDDDDLSKSKRF